MVLHPYKILVLSRNYPSNILPGLGLWVKRLVHHCKDRCELKVVSPVPYFPPIGILRKYSKFSLADKYACNDGIETFYPRFLVGPGRSIYITEALMYYIGIWNTVKKLSKTFAFNLIHAHFSYPDGFAAALLGRHYKVPVVITEHALWKPNWMDKHRLIRWQAVWTAKECKALIAVSSSVKDTITYFTGQPEKIRIIPVGTDGSTFTTPQNHDTVNKNQILYVGFLNFNKGVDILLKAFSLVLKTKPDAKLVLVGGSFYRNAMKQENQLRSLAKDFGLDSHVEFAGIKSPSEVAKYMRESALLVLPSRAESFGAVLVEALACGTPVVATRCGGPEDIITNEVGTLVEKDNDTALAQALEQILTHQGMYDRAKLRAYALDNFSWERVASKTIDLYRETIEK